jgi:hypothetical protein
MPYDGPAALLVIDDGACGTTAENGVGDADERRRLVMNAKADVGVRTWHHLVQLVNDRHGLTLVVNSDHRCTMGNDDE